MSDVAARAGVSHQTVSRVVNGSTFVRPDTKERVLEAIVELGYRRNPAARALVTRRSGVVGVVVADLRYYGPSSTVIGIESAARAAGCSTILASLPDVTADAVEGALEHVMSAGAEAVVVIGHHDTGLDLGRGSEYGVPIVVLDGETSRSSLAVGVDQRAGAVIVTQHLIDLGHRRIAHLSGPPSWFQAQQRLEGWRLTLEHAGLPVSTPLTGDWSAAGGYLLGQQLAADRQVTAVFAANDQMRSVCSVPSSRQGAESRTRSAWWGSTTSRRRGFSVRLSRQCARTSRRWGNMQCGWSWDRSKDTLSGRAWCRPSSSLASRRVPRSRRARGGDRCRLPK